MLYAKVKAKLDEILGCDVVLERPKNRDFGHFATPVAFVLAKIQRKNPKILSEEIAQKLREIELFAQVDTLNGYINLTLKQELFLEALEEILKEGFKPFAPRGERILLEYVSANPTGPLHIGHARGAIYGDALYRIGNFLGYEIESEYYINDAGAQISMLGLSILLAGKEEILGEEVIYPQQYYRGEYIIDLAKAASEKFGKEIFASQQSIAQLAEFGKDLMLEEIKRNLASVGINFDHFVSEKLLYDRWEEILKELEDNGGIYKNEGKVWLKSSEHGDEKDRVVVRESGEPTYLAGDIIYHADKFQRNYDHYINIWGADHHGYIARVKAAIEFLGFKSNRLEVLLSQMVKLLKKGMPYKMSKRAGNFILMQDVVNDIGADALRFVFLCKKADISLEFDVDDLKKEDSSNPIFYINYANARICTLIEKSGRKLDEIRSVKLESIDADEEGLIFLSSQLPQVLISSFLERSPLKVCDYLKSLASQLHAFYNAQKILGEKREAQRLKILLGVSIALESALGLLGIQAKKKM
ncbi:arginine--tRNA ligase [Helicobacter cholecystus]|uniref:arginine--tRNA ligase n=1 Tax=Helicobacter cholecystus TaxID=45498 RepID=UPI002739442A|nr:arginine--tRNA ligase [Helicobacter cholecystus]